MKRSISLFGFAALLGAGGCVCYANGGNGTGSLNFLWTFNGGQSCEVAGVAYVEIQVDGAPTQTVSCRDQNGVNGATVADLPGGHASFTLTGEDANQNPLYQDTGGIPLEAGAATQLSVDLAPLATAVEPSSDIEFLWTFDGKSCVQASVAQVVITMPGQQLQQPVQPCALPNSTQIEGGAIVHGFAPGSYPFELRGEDGSGNVLYQGSGTVYVNGTGTTIVNIDLPAVANPPSQQAGKLTLDWTFGGQSCTAAGVDHVHVTLQDSTGAAVQGTDQTVLCSQYPNGLAYDSLAPATYWLDIQGIASAKVTYQTVNYQVAVVAGSNATDTIDVSKVP